MEAISSVKRRAFRSKSAILELLGEQQQSGLSIQGFCSQYSIPSGSFHNWKKKYGTGDGGSSAFTLGSWLQQQYVQVLPKSAIGEAVAYSLKRSQRLSAYVNNGRLNIDNNPVENSIRPVAVGRKNYLFAGSHEAAKRSGMLYSLLGTCKMHGIEPYAWLKDILHCIADHPINQVKDLLPHRYKK
ncbi:MAG TPA: transposase [Chitinophagaceae bacterium]|nr:transposase [Chitinophagaceae bacterium]